MSSTAIPRRIEHGAEALTRQTPTAIAALLLATLMISFHPFNPDLVVTGGDTLNQIGFSALGALALFSLAAFAEPRRALALVGPSMLVMLGFFALSVANATDPAAALRASSFSLIGMLAIGALLVLPRDADAFSVALFAGGMAVIGLSYAGLLVFPHEAIHQADSVEPQHAGLWRGVFTHKNIAGPVMACFSFCGLYLWRRGDRAMGAVLFVLAMVFTINTGSKATAGLVPLAMLIVIVPGLFGMRALAPVLFVLVMAAAALATVGTVFLAPMKTFAAAYFSDPTFTGRVTLWEFAGEMIAKRPWSGYGYESFWGTDFLLNTDNPFDRPWDIRPMVHGHDGYIDIALIMGVPALLAAIWAFFVAPLVDYMRVPQSREAVCRADLFLMILLFTGLNAFLESFFFRRADPVWMFFVFGVMGMRLVARFPQARGAGALSQQRRAV